MSASTHMRGIAIAGALAVLALALGFVTLGMNQTASPAAVHVVLPLHARHHAATKTTTAAATATAKTKPKKKVKPVDPNYAAAVAAGLPPAVARGLAAAPVSVVQLASSSDPVSQLASAEAKSGSDLSGASYVSVSVDRDGGPVESLTRLLGTLPDAPASLVYVRPSQLFVTLTGFNDRTVVEQAVQNAAATSTGAAALAAAPDWSTRADVLCREAYAQFGVMGGLGAPARLATNKVKFEAVATGFLAQFGKLTPPAGKSAVVKQLNTLLAKQFADEDAMVAASARGDAAALAAARAKESSVGSQVSALEQRLGAAGCVEGTT